MKRPFRLLPLTLAAALLLSQGAQAARFSDLSSSHWAYEDMAQAVELGIITGYDDGSIRPEDTLTWGQYLVMLDRAFYPETYAALVASGKVSLNHRECLKADRPVGEGDVLTCRGLGKCVVKESRDSPKRAGPCW